MSVFLNINNPGCPILVKLLTPVFYYLLVSLLIILTTCRFPWIWKLNFADREKNTCLVITVWRAKAWEDNDKAWNEAGFRHSFYSYLLHVTRTGDKWWSDGATWLVCRPNFLPFLTQSWCLEWRLLCLETKHPRVRMLSLSWITDVAWTGCSFGVLWLDMAS